MRRLALPRQARSDAEPGQPHLAGRLVEQDVRGLYIFVNEAALVEFAEIRGNTDSQGQEASDLHWPTEQPVERLAARILKHQHRPTGVTHEVQRAHRPCPVELILEFIFVRESIEACAGQ